MSLSWGSLPQDMLIKVNRLMSELYQYDKETYHHCMRVSQLCRFLAESAHLNSYQQLVAQFSGLLHDVGKMKTPQGILNKPARLTDDEYNEMKLHPVKSAELLEPLESSSFFREVQVAVLHHHERVDGMGYPYGLSEEQIPYISKIILIVDTVDAMTQSRPYRKGLPLDVAYKELERCAGTQFDPELVEIFVREHKKSFEKNPLDEKVVALPSKQRVA